MGVARSLLCSACVGMVALAGCSGSGRDAAPRRTDPAFSTTTTARPDDGVLRLGLVGDPKAPAAMESSVANAATIAVRQINDAGGVDGQPVVLVGPNDPSLSVEATVGRLLDGQVDAIIGPLSSTDTLSELGRIVGRGVLDCSPTASAMALDGFPDRGLFFRTIPSDSLQAAAIATAVERTGVATVSLAYLDDPYGRPFAEAVRTELEARSISVSGGQAFDAGTVDEAATTIAADGPPVVVVIADATNGPALITAVERHTTSRPLYFINDAQRHPQTLQPLAPDTLQRVVGISPATTPADDDLTTAVLAVDPNNQAIFAANAFDCVNLIALAALSAGTTESRDIAREMSAVSAGGSKCSTFATCRDDLVENRNIDYDGATRVLDLAANGDPSRALFEEFDLLPDGHDRVVDRIAVSTRNATS